MSAYIYKYVEEDGNVLYVGITNDLERRIKQHGRSGDNISKEFWPHLQKCRIYYFKAANMNMADVIESELIRRLNPPANVAKSEPSWDGLPLPSLPWTMYSPAATQSKKRRRILSAQEKIEKFHHEKALEYDSVLMGPAHSISATAVADMFRREVIREDSSYFEFNLLGGKEIQEEFIRKWILSSSEKGLSSFAIKVDKDTYKDCVVPLLNYESIDKNGYRESVKARFDRGIVCNANGVQEYTVVSLATIADFYNNRDSSVFNVYKKK